MLHRERKIRAKMIQRHSELLHQLRQTRLLSRCSAVRGLTASAPLQGSLRGGSCFARPACEQTLGAYHPSPAGKRMGGARHFG